MPIEAANAIADNVEDATITAAYGNQFHIPLDFELLESHIPFHQSGFGNCLEYKLAFNDYARVI